MSGERRTVSRREPTVIEVEGVGDFAIEPLPWRKRNDLGDLIAGQYAHALNEAKRGLTDGTPEEWSIDHFRGFESYMDYTAIYRATSANGFDNGDVERFEALGWEDMLKVLDTSLDVNGLGRLANMLDPDRAVRGTVIPLPETSPNPSDGDGPKTASGPDSSAPPDGTEPASTT
jgi:hypothetical protein